MTDRDEVGAVFGDLLRELDALLPAEGAAEATAGSDAAPYVAAAADLLGFLAERMTELHRERQGEVASFLEWLEGRLDCSVDDLSGKTYVRAYYEQPEGADKLLEVIESNSVSLTGIDASAPDEYGRSNPERERIRKGFERSMATLRPILHQLALTDRLIDLIVYRLYGLTDAEVEIVERYTDPSGLVSG